MDMKVSIIAEVKVPKVPNFIILTDGQKFPLSAFTKKGLSELADEWKANLLARADEMRASGEEI